MKALTIRQPWASLIAVGAKTIETRSWRTHYRGPLMIHAAAGTSKLERDLMTREPFASALGMEQGDHARIVVPPQRGVVLAVADLVDCIHAELFAKARLAHRRPCIRIDGGGFVRAAAHEYEFGDYANGRFGWVLDNVRPLANPVPASGALSLWTPTTDVEMPVLAQLEAVHA